MPSIVRKPKKAIAPKPPIAKSRVPDFMGLGLGAGVRLAQRIAAAKSSKIASGRGAGRNR